MSPRRSWELLRPSVDNPVMESSRVRISHSYQKTKFCFEYHMTRTGMYARVRRTSSIRGTSKACILSSASLLGYRQASRYRCTRRSPASLRYMCVCIEKLLPVPVYSSNEHRDLKPPASFTVRYTRGLSQPRWYGGRTCTFFSFCSLRNIRNQCKKHSSHTILVGTSKVRNSIDQCPREIRNAPSKTEPRKKVAKGC